MNSNAKSEGGKMKTTWAEGRERISTTAPGSNDATDRHAPRDERRLARPLTCALVALLASFQMLVSQPASAQMEQVVTFAVGGTKPEFSVEGTKFGGFDWGYDVGGAVGIQFGKIVRWDVLDLHYTSAEFGDNIDVNAVTLVTGAKVGWFSPDAMFQPYASVGLGGGNVGFVGNSTRFGQWGLAWDLGAGVEMPLGKSGASIGARYRYRAIELRGNGLPDARASTHAIGIEILYANGF
jgi:hypothetical protein